MTLRYFIALIILCSIMLSANRVSKCEGKIGKNLVRLWLFLGAFSLCTLVLEIIDIYKNP